MCNLYYIILIILLLNTVHPLKLLPIFQTYSRLGIVSTVEFFYYNYSTRLIHMSRLDFTKNKISRIV